MLSTRGSFALETMVSFVCGWQIWKTKTMFTNKKNHQSNFSHIHFFKPYSRNFKIFTGPRPAGSIITGHGFCMGLSVLVAEIWARNWWSENQAYVCQRLAVRFCQSLLSSWNGVFLWIYYGGVLLSLWLSAPIPEKRDLFATLFQKIILLQKMGMMFLSLAQW